ncbi:unannotated protein [freshwater metagenome]|uniref:Unannotated protein n=1 Tax=freshwater metagenome TaxID=449393 RepID=A0A6J6BVX0_9ZZZZ
MRWFPGAILFERGSPTATLKKASDDLVTPFAKRVCAIAEPVAPASTFTSTDLLLGSPQLKSGEEDPGIRMKCRDNVRRNTNESAVKTRRAITLLVLFTE